jgi:hypothetical protein
MCRRDQIRRERPRSRKAAEGSHFREGRRKGRHPAHQQARRMSRNR